MAALPQQIHELDLLGHCAGKSECSWWAVQLALLSVQAKEWSASFPGNCWHCRPSQVCLVYKSYRLYPFLHWPDVCQASIASILTTRPKEQHVWPHKAKRHKKLGSGCKERWVFMQGSSWRRGPWKCFPLPHLWSGRALPCVPRLWGCRRSTCWGQSGPCCRSWHHSLVCPHPSLPLNPMLSSLWWRSQFLWTIEMTRICMEAIHWEQADCSRFCWRIKASGHRVFAWIHSL